MRRLRTIIAGSRDISGEDAARVIAVLDACEWPIEVVLSGCARGVDTIGAEWARGRGLPVEEHPAIWGAWGCGAGPIRNQAMAEAADAAIIVRHAQSRGSEDMARRARAAGLRLLEVVL